MSRQMVDGDTFFHYNIVPQSCIHSRYVHNWQIRRLYLHEFPRKWDSSDFGQTALVHLEKRVEFQICQVPLIPMNVETDWSNQTQNITDRFDWKQKYRKNIKLSTFYLIWRLSLGRWHYDWQGKSHGEENEEKCWQVCWKVSHLYNVY